MNRMTKCLALTFTLMLAAVANLALANGSDAPVLSRIEQRG